METVVLPAQDHLARERYRHQSRVMSGMIYPLGGLPRTRKKVRSPQQAFVAASLHPDYARISAHTDNAEQRGRSGLVSQMDMSLGVLRSAPSSASTPHLPPLSVLKAPQYRLNNASPYGLVSSESMSMRQPQRTASLSAATPVLNGAPTSWKQLLRTRSDGELSQQSSRKGGEGEKPSSDRRRAHEKGSEGSKGSADRKGAEKAFEKNVEKSSDRRKGLDRRTMEKKALMGLNSSQGDKNSNVQKKTGVITILQRPQTKEAAAENIALFTGRPIEDVTKHVVKSAQAGPQPQSKKGTVEVAAAAAVDSVKDSYIRSKYGGETETAPSSRALRNVSPKRERVAKKKPSRDSSGKPAGRMVDALNLDSRRTQDAEFSGELRSRSPETVSLEAKVTPGERPRSNDAESSKSAGRTVDALHTDSRRTQDAEFHGDDQAKIAPVERPRSNDAEFFTHPRGLAAKMYGSFVAGLDTFLAELDDQQQSKSVVQETKSSLVTTTSLELVLSNGIDTASTPRPRGIHRGSSDSILGDIGRALPEALKGDVVSLPDDTDLFFLPSSPPKNSERWAGPAYTNSPPPSTLPLPTFPLQRVKSSMTEAAVTEVVLAEAEVTSAETVSSSMPSPEEVADMFLAGMAIHQPSFVNTSSATKDLRRMLNLDVEDFEWTEADESATQGLKRMLQLR